MYSSMTVTGHSMVWETMRREDRRRTRGGIFHNQSKRGKGTFEGVSVSWNSAKARRISGFACRPMLTAERVVD